MDGLNEDEPNGARAEVLELDPEAEAQSLMPNFYPIVQGAQLVACGAMAVAAIAILVVQRHIRRDHPEISRANSR